MSANNVAVALTDGGGGKPYGSGGFNAQRLRVDTEKLRAKGTSLVSQAASMSESIGTIGTQVATINDGWRDATGEEFTEKFATFNSSYTPISACMNTLGTYMSDFADKYETALETAVNSIEE